MTCITDIETARSLFLLYDQIRLNQSSVSDQQLLQAINSTYWVTNASCAVFQALSIIAPACLFRPHLTKILIRAPMGALIASGNEDPLSIIKAGAVLLQSNSGYTTPDEFGVLWIRDVLPTLNTLVQEVFPDVLRECYE